jgi:hypothetical protein
MSVRIQLDDDHHATLISAYAPTLYAEETTKNAFYDELEQLVTSIPVKDKLFILGDFNARVGRNVAAWQGVLGHHGVGNENLNGTRLLTFCAQHELLITNTVFQQANKYKTTWMHPRSQHWHLIDYIMVRQSDRRDVNLTRCMRGTTCWTDHRLLRCHVSLHMRHPQRLQGRKLQKYNVAKLKEPAVRDAFVSDVSRDIQLPDSAAQSAEASWTRLKEAMMKAAGNNLGRKPSSHRDWFDENDAEAQQLLDELHRTHAAWLQDKNSPRKKAHYLEARRCTQRKLRNMKDKWWSNTAAQLQDAADSHDMKRFYDGLKAIHGPKASGSVPVKAADETTVLRNPSEILQRWADHFNGVLNQPSTFDTTVINELPVFDTNTLMDLPPSMEEVRQAISKLSTGKAAGGDGIPPEFLKTGSEVILKELTDLFKLIWEEEQVPKDFRDGTIVHLYKRKGDRSSCDNHRGITLLSVAGKVLARVLLHRLQVHLDKIQLIPESQCGFRPERGTTDMVFSLRQLQEKCREQQEELYLIFIDLTKAFDSVNREGLWLVLQRIGCPEKFIKLVRSLHDGMEARVCENGCLSEPFQVTNGTKQGCVLAPTLFSVFFSAMLFIAFKDCQAGIALDYRTDRNLFDLRKLQAKTKVNHMTLRDLLFADDCALAATTMQAAQQLLDRFATSARRFGLTLSLKKTEVMHQPAPDAATATPPVLTVDGAALRATDKFCYLGSTVAQDLSMDTEIAARLSKAAASFGRLTGRVWDERGLRLTTKISVYNAVVLSSLLYGCQTWTLYRRHVRLLEEFHMRSLRRILHITWRDRVTNCTVLSRCKACSIESILMQKQLQWTGHVIRMHDSRIPKQLLYGELAARSRKPGGQKKRYKDSLQATLKACEIPLKDLEKDANDRTRWRSTTRACVSRFESRRNEALEGKRRLRHDPASAPASVFICDICQRDCHSRIGLFAHRRSHRRDTSTTTSQP